MAKFKKGDRVVATEPNYQTKGVGVVRGYEYSWDEEIERDDPGYYIVDFPNQYKVKMSKGSLRLANAACSTNSIVAKAMNAVARNYDVKPGWTNRWSGELKPGTKITVVDSPMRYGGMAGEVVRRDGSRYVVRLDDIAGMEVHLNPNQISVKNADTSTVSEKAVNAKFYATGYTNGGANEKQIGPFKTKEEAIKAGREEQGASGTFRFAGVVGEDGAYVYHNSCSRNAKFKAGDKVYFHGRPATVKQVIREPDADYILDVQGDEFYAEDEEVTSRNSRVRNAVVAKALNARARNDKQFHTYLVPVLRKGVKDYVTIERVADEETAKKLVDVPSFRIIGVTVDKTRPVKKARNAEDDFLQYYADSYSYIPKVGEIYKYDGKRVKCTSVQKLQRGNDDRDRFLVEGRVVG